MQANCCCISQRKLIFSLRVRSAISTGHRRMIELDSQSAVRGKIHASFSRACPIVVALLVEADDQQDASASATAICRRRQAGCQPRKVRRLARETEKGAEQSTGGRRKSPHIQFRRSAGWSVHRIRLQNRGGGYVSDLHLDTALMNLLRGRVKNVLGNTACEPVPRLVASRPRQTLVRGSVDGIPPATDFSS